MLRRNVDQYIYIMNYCVYINESIMLIFYCITQRLKTVSILYCAQVCLLVNKNYILYKKKNIYIYNVFLQKKNRLDKHRIAQRVR